MPIENDAKKIRHLLNVAMRDMKAYARLESGLDNNPLLVEGDFSYDSNINVVGGWIYCQTHHGLCRFSAAGNNYSHVCTASNYVSSDACFPTSDPGDYTVKMLLCEKTTDIIDGDDWI